MYEKTAETIAGEKVLREKYTLAECEAMLRLCPDGVDRLLVIAQKGLRARRVQARPLRGKA